jgi:hypothetical protein
MFTEVVTASLIFSHAVAQPYDGIHEISESYLQP